MPRKKAILDEIALNAYDYGQSSERGRLITADWQELLHSMTLRKATGQWNSAIKFISALGREVGFIDTTPTPPPRVARDFLCERHVKFSQDILRVFGKTVRIYITSGSNFNTQDYRHLKEMLFDAGLGNRVFIVIVPGHALEAKGEARHDKSGLAVIDSDDVKEMTMHPAPCRVFYRIVRQQTKIELLQPYDHFGAVRHSMFFGRQTQQAKLLDYIPKSDGWNKAKGRHNKHCKDAWERHQTYPLLAYALFSDLKEVIKENWSIFGNQFQPQDKFFGYFDRLEELRNDVAHNRPISHQNLRELESIRKSFENCMIVS